MVLVIDIGNTSTTLGLYGNGRVRLLRRLETEPLTVERIARFIRSVPGVDRVHASAIASVVPKAKKNWQAALKKTTSGKTWWLTHRVDLGLPLDYPEPNTLGADRLANVVAGHERYGAPVIVADFGTALTIDLVTRKKGFVGGVITAGPDLVLNALHQKTAKLPVVTWGPVRSKVGKSTGQAIQLGARWGYQGMVQEIVARLKKEAGPGKVTVCATGGFASRIADDLKFTMKVDPDLTLYGIGRLYERNVEGK